MECLLSQKSCCYMTPPWGRLLDWKKRNRAHLDWGSQYRFPSIGKATAYIRDGGLLSYGPSFPDMYRRSAGYVAKILKGTKPSELPVQQPTRFELAVNLKTAETLILLLPASLLGHA